METQKAKISKFSKLICIVINITFIAVIIIGVMQVLSWVVDKWNLPYIFKIGDMSVTLPVILTDKIDVGDASLFVPEFVKGNITAILQTAAILVILSFAKKFFKLLVDDGTPFRAEVVKNLRNMAIVLIVLGAFSGLAVFIAAGVVYVLSLVFDYGYTLQNESDTTL